MHLGHRGAPRPAMPRRHITVAAVVLALVGVVAGSSTTLGASRIVQEINASANLLAKRFPSNNATEPVIAVDPTDATRMALTYNTRGARCGISPGVRVSLDGGATWKDAARKPWAGSGRFPNWHATLAWGPGPEQGKSRLYWADTTVRDCTFSDHRLSIAYSDDLGATWSKLFVYQGSAATPFGGYPDISVDRNPASPNYGVVYAAINWFARSADEPGFRLIASADFGTTWSAAEVGALPARSGYRFRYRIGYRLRAAPDGALYATFCQRDRRSPSGAVGRLAFGVSRVTFDRTTGTLAPSPPALAAKVNVNSFTLGGRAAPGTRDRLRLNPCWTHGLDVDSNGDVYLAIANFRPKPGAGETRGVVLLGRSSDAGTTWSWRTLPSLAPAEGRSQSAHKPALVVENRTVFVGFHVLADVPLASGVTPAAVVGNAYTVSYDQGATFEPPTLISNLVWHPDWLDHSRNASGIRDRAELAGTGTVVYAYGDGRDAAAKPDARWGRGQIYVASIELGTP